MRKPHRPTSTDVARLAGVSRGTVSNVLNGDPDRLVRPETARRVLDAAAALGYVPSAAARLLRGASARFVLVLSPGHSNGIQGSRILEELARALEPRDLGLVHLTGHPHGLHPAGHLSPAVVLSAAGVDDPEFAEMSRGFRAPFLPAFPGRDAHISAAAHAQIAFAADRGVTQVVYVAPSEPALGSMARLRHEALAEHATYVGVRVVDAVTLGDDREAWARQASRWRAQHGRGTLVCAYNDDVALAVLAGAHDAGIAVPEDLGVIGADDIAAAASAIPALTSVGADLGPFVRAMAAAVEAAALGEPYELPALPTDLRVTVRASTP